MPEQDWSGFLENRKPVTVLSFGGDTVRKSHRLTDVYLANLFAFKQYARSERFTVIIDEIEDLWLDEKAPLAMILRKGGKSRLTLLLASQSFSDDNDRLGNLIGNCGMKVFFHPKDDCIGAIAKKYDIDRQQLAALEQGECFAVGGFYSREKARNTRTVLRGRAFRASELLPHAKQPPAQEPQSTENPTCASGQDAPKT